VNTLLTIVSYHYKLFDHKCEVDISVLYDNGNGHTEVAALYQFSVNTILDVFKTVLDVPVFFFDS